MYPILDEGYLYTIKDEYAIIPFCFYIKKIDRSLFLSRVLSLQPRRYFFD